MNPLHHLDDLHYYTLRKYDETLDVRWMEANTMLTKAYSKIAQADQVRRVPGLERSA